MGFIDRPMYAYVLRGDSLSQSIDADPWGELVAQYRDNVLIYNLLSGGGI